MLFFSPSFFSPPFIDIFNDYRCVSEYLRDNGYFKSVFENGSDADGNNCLELLSDAIKREDFELTKSILEVYPHFTKLNFKNINWLKMLREGSRTFFDKCFDLALERSYMNIIVAYLQKDFNRRLFLELMSHLKPINSNENELSFIQRFETILLYMAIVKGLPKAVAFLLENNVKPNVTYHRLGSPLSVAIKQLKYPTTYSFDKMELSDYQAINPMLYDIIEMLLKKNVTQRQEICFGNLFEVYTPLTFSVNSQDLRLFKLLLANNPYLAYAPPIEATARFLNEADFSGKTPLVIATKVKSKKMYDYIMSLCPDLLIKNISAVGHILFNNDSYSKFMEYVLSPIPYEQRKLLFQPFHTKQREAGDVAVCLALKNDALSAASALLKLGSNLPTDSDAIGNTRLHNLAKRRIASDKWQPLFEKYSQELKAAEVTPSLVEMTTNVIHEHTHQSQFAMDELQGYLPQELFELYQSTPQRREYRETHFKPMIRECLDKALQPKEESINQGQEKRAKM